MFKAVIFDVDGVLLDSFEANFTFYQKLMAHAGYSFPNREGFRNLFHLSMLDTIKEVTGSASEEEIRKIWNVGKNRIIAYPTEMLAVPPKAAETIKILSKKYLLGIVTSRVKKGVYEAPKLAQLKKHFRVTVSFEDTEKHKPDPEPLLLAAQLLAIKPEESVYVGDTESDVKAAHAAGMKALAYSKETVRDADMTTSVFENIPHLIEKI